jgi:hypothetical protein
MSPLFFVFKNTVVKGFAVQLAAWFHGNLFLSIPNSASF